MKKVWIHTAFSLFLLAQVLPLFAGGGQDAKKGTASDDIGFNATGLPIVSKPYTISGVVQKNAMHGAYSGMESLQRMERETGVKVEWIEIPENNFAERKNLMLASNDLPDVFFSGLNDSDLLRYGPTGTLLPLDKLIDQYAPRIKALFTSRPDIKKYVTLPDGHIYNLPGNEEAIERTNQDNWFINKAWLDKLGLKLPTTWEEFYTVLKAFKERDPNGNGKRDEIPFSFATFGDQFNIYSLFAGFGQIDYPEHVIVVNGKVNFTANTPEFRSALVYFRRLYSEGLIDAEAFTQDRAKYFGKGVEPDELYGSFLGWFDENEVGDKRAKEDYTTLPPLKGTDGKQHWNVWPYNILERQHFGITNKLKHPEVAIRWADLCYDTDHSIELKLGSWDINIKREGDKIAFIQPPAGQTQDEFRYKHTPAVTMPFVLYEADLARRILTDNVQRKIQRYALYSPFFPPQDLVYPRVFFLPEEESELAILRTDVQGYVNQMRSKFIIGTESIDTGWNSYVQTLNQAGLARYLELYQKALDRYNSN